MQEKLITSRQNPLIQHVKKLQQSKNYRRQAGQFVADGTKLLHEAIAWYPGLHTVIAEQGVSLPALPETATLVLVPTQLMQWLSSMQTPQGVVFVCDVPPQREPELKPGCVILDGIQDPGNLGTILRTADALDVPVILSDGCADPYNEKTVRASMGAVFRVQPGSASRQEILKKCAHSDLPLAVTALTQDALDLRRVPLKQYAVVIGSEGQGVCPQYLQAADLRVVIPMNNHCESLNAAVASAIVMWQMRR